jgi:hypothetical protein
VDSEDLIRALAFDYVDQLSDHGEVPIAWADLINFSFEGRRVPLVSQQGIFKPAVLDLPISIRTIYREPGQLRPYEDEVDENGYLLYRHRGTDPGHHENQWLRQVRDRAVPLLYLEGVAKGRYLPSAAAIIEDHPESLTFGVQLMPIDAAAIGPVNAFAIDPATRRHYLALVQRHRAGTIPGVGPRRIRQQMHPVPTAASGVVGCGPHRFVCGGRDSPGYERDVHVHDSSPCLRPRHCGGTPRWGGGGSGRCVGRGGWADAPPRAAGGAWRADSPSPIAGVAALGRGAGAAVREVSGAGGLRCRARSFGRI